MNLIAFSMEFNQSNCEARKCRLYGSSFNLFVQKCDAVSVSQLYLLPTTCSTSTGVIYKQLWVCWDGSCLVTCHGLVFHTVVFLEREDLVEPKTEILADFNLLCDLQKPLNLSEL